MFDALFLFCEKVWGGHDVNMVVDTNLGVGNMMVPLKIKLKTSLKRYFGYSSVWN